MKTMSSMKDSSSTQSDENDQSNENGRLRHIKSHDPRCSWILGYRRVPKNMVESIYYAIQASDPRIKSLNFAVATEDTESFNSLLAGISPNILDIEEGNTPLQIALLHGRIDMAQQLIEAGANVNGSDYYGNNISLHRLHLAVLKENIKMVQLLVDAGASQNPLNSDGDTPLLLAIVNDIRIDLIEQLIKAGADVHVSDSYGNTSLHLAVLKRRFEMVQLLLSVGALLDLVNSEGFTPLMMIFKRKGTSAMQKPSDSTHDQSSHQKFTDDDFDIMQVLLKAGASPNSVEKEGDTPLLLAIRWEEIKLVQQLIDGGADVNYIYPVWNSGGQPKSTLHEAVHACNVEIVRLLLSHGADPNRANRLEYSVLISASRASRNKIPIMNLLLDHGASMYEGGRGNGPFGGRGVIMAEMLNKNNVDGVRLFLERGFDLQEFGPQSKEYLTPLQHTLYFKGESSFEVDPDTSMLELLLDHYKNRGILATEIDRAMVCWRTGWTALFFTAEGSRHKHMKLLLDAGANPNFEDEEGRIPLEIGLFMTNYYSTFSYECTRLLIKAGSKIRNYLDRLIHQAKTEDIADESYEDYFDGSLLETISKQENTSLVRDHEHVDLYIRKASFSMQKAMCIVKYRVLYESHTNVDDPVNERMKDSPTLQNYYDACKTEIASLKKHRFDDSVTSYDVLVKQDFWKRVKCPDAFEDFHDKCMPHSGEDISENIHIYAKYLENRWRSGYDKYKLWRAAENGLEYFLGFNKDSYHLIFSNILGRLKNVDLRNLGAICNGGENN